MIFCNGFSANVIIFQLWLSHYFRSKKTRNRDYHNVHGKIINQFVINIINFNFTANIYLPDPSLCGFRT